MRTEEAWFEWSQKQFRLDKSQLSYPNLFSAGLVVDLPQIVMFVRQSCFAFASSMNRTIMCSGAIVVYFLDGFEYCSVCDRIY